MSPFTIHCTTCHAKLKVRDASAVGQILGCPKCGSMVLIEPPAESAGSPQSEPALLGTQSPPQSPVIHSTGLLPGSLPAPVDKQSEMPPAELRQAELRPENDLQDTIVDSSLYNDLGPSAFESGSSSRGIAAALPVEPGIGERFSEVDPSFADSSPRPVSTSAWATEPLVPVAAAPPLPLDDWNSAATQQWRQWLALGGAAIGGIALAIGLFGFYISRRSPADPKQAPPVPTVAAVDLESGIAPTDPLPAPDVAQTEPPTSARDPHVPPSSPASAALAEEAESGDATSTETPRDQVPTEPAESPAPAMAQSNDTATPENSEGDPTDLTGVASGNPAVPGPPDLKPAGGVSEESTADSAGGERVAPKPLPAQIASVTPTIDFSAITEFTPEIRNRFGPEPSAELGPQDDNMEAAAEVAEANEPAPEPVNIAARLADPIASMEMTEAPLADFVQLLTDFSTIPITLDVESLSRRGISLELPITVSLADTNVAGVLAAALEPVGLVFEARGAQLVVRSGARSGRQPEAYPVSDLAADEATLRQLAELVKAIVEPAAWNADQGALRIDVEKRQVIVEHDSTIRYQVGLFLDRLRLARDIPRRGNYPERLLALAPSYQRAGSALATQVMANFNRPARLTRILDYLGERTQMRVVVDWEALASVGWTPFTQTSTVIQNKTLAGGLGMLLEPLELTYYVLDERTLMVTTPAAAVERVEVAFHKLEEPLVGQAAARRLTELQAALSRAGASEDRFTLRYDLTGSYLIARLSPSQQQVLAGLLSATP